MIELSVDVLAQALNYMDNTLTATVAECRRRRSESPWKGPFIIEGCHVCDDEGDSFLEMDYQRDAVTIAAALNAYYGFTPDGKDALEGM